MDSSWFESWVDDMKQSLVALVPGNDQCEQDAAQNKPDTIKDNFLFDNSLVFDGVPSAEKHVAQTSPLVPRKTGSWKATSGLSFKVFEPAIEKKSILKERKLNAEQAIEQALFGEPESDDTELDEKASAEMALVFKWEKIHHDNEVLLHKAENALEREIHEKVQLQLGHTHGVGGSQKNLDELQALEWKRRALQPLVDAVQNAEFKASRHRHKMRAAMKAANGWSDEQTTELWSGAKVAARKLSVSSETSGRAFASPSFSSSFSFASPSPSKAGSFSSRSGFKTEKNRRLSVQELMRGGDHAGRSFKDLRFAAGTP